MYQGITSTLALIVSALALGVSVVNAWFTQFRRGQLRMTRPMMVSLFQDGKEDQKQKIVVRALLYCTAYRGVVVENMYAMLRKQNVSTTLVFWAYAGADGKIQRGGGIFVGREGVALNHHFVCLGKNAPTYEPGKYTVEIYATTTGNDTPIQLATCNIELTEPMATMLNDKSGGVMFNWNPNSVIYQPEIKPNAALAETAVRLE